MSSTNQVFEGGFEPKIARGEDFSLDNVTVEYGRNLGLDSLTLSLKAGQAYALLGHNGAGKTSLISVLTGQITPDFGRISYGAQPFKRSRVLPHLGFVPQQSSLDGKLTVAENLAFFAALHGLRGAALRDKVEEALGEAGLVAQADQLAATLSGGQKRRVEVARALLHAPTLLVLDEPTMGIDPQSRSAIWQRIAAARAARPITLVIASHHLDEIAFTQEVILLNQGKVARQMPTAEVLQHARGAWLRLRPKDAAARAALLQHLPKARVEGEDVLHDPLPPAQIAQILPWTQKILSEGVSLETVLRDMIAGAQ